MPNLTSQDKDMKNTILIDPVDEDMALLANAVLILNNYKKIGFNKRESFVELIMDVDKSYQTLQGMQKLNNFWAGRVKDACLNKDLVRIYEGLKTS
jgi:hypothetical protein